MPGLEDLYREIILDHYRSPRNRGELPTPPAVVAQGHNPLCGDEITVFLQVDDGVVSDVQVGGQGCSISQSSASMMSQAIKGQPVDDVRALVRRFKGMMSIEDADDGATAMATPPARGRGARRPRGAAGRREVPGADQVRHAGLEHAARGARAGRRDRPPRSVLDDAAPPDDDAEARSRAGRADPPARPRAGRSRGARRRCSRRWPRRSTTLAAGSTPAGRRATGPPSRSAARRGTEPGSRRARGRRPTTTARSRGASRPWGLDLEVHRRGDEIDGAADARRRPRGRAGTLPRRHRRRPVRRRLRLRARHPPGAGVHRRAGRPLRRGRRRCTASWRAAAGWPSAIGRKLWIEGELVDVETGRGSSPVVAACSSPSTGRRCCRRAPASPPRPTKVPNGEPSRLTPARVAHRSRRRWPARARPARWRTRRATSRRRPTPRRRRGGRGRRRPAAGVAWPNGGTPPIGKPVAVAHGVGVDAAAALAAGGGRQLRLVELVGAADEGQDDLAVDGEDQALHDLADVDADRRRRIDWPSWRRRAERTGCSSGRPGGPPRRRGRRWGGRRSRCRPFGRAAPSPALAHASAGVRAVTGPPQARARRRRPASSTRRRGTTSGSRRRCRTASRAAAVRRPPRTS